jgi:hypothetical protein
MSRQNSSQKPDLTVELPFDSVRHISSPEDMENERRVYAGYTTIAAIVDLPADENVRDYLLDAEGKVRRRPTLVHRDILDTLENHSEDFSVLNSGIVLVARKCDIDEKRKMLILTKASIINGSQTQGVIRGFLKERGDAAPCVHIKFEIIVTSDEGLIADISIARNNQDNVQAISRVGAKGLLDELEKHLQMRIPRARLQKSETDLGETFIKTQRLIQVIAALVPEELWLKEGEFSKVYTYSQRTKCLRDFQEIYQRAKNPDDAYREDYQKLYEFYLDVAADAHRLYEKWKTHQGFRGTGLRSIERNGREIADVPDGIIFPIIASFSVFAEKTRDGWRIACPSVLPEEDLIAVAKRAYMELARSNPNKMGKTKACYSMLNEKTADYRKFQTMLAEVERRKRATG